MKIVVRGIKDEMLKEEVKAIIREYCERDSVYAKGFFFRKRQEWISERVEIYPTGSKSMVGLILYEVGSRVPHSYTVVKRRRVVKVYALK